MTESPVLFRIRLHEGDPEVELIEVLFEHVPALVVLVPREIDALRREEHAVVEEVDGERGLSGHIVGDRHDPVAKVGESRAGEELGSVVLVAAVGQRVVDVSELLHLGR